MQKIDKIVRKNVSLFFLSGIALLLLSCSGGDYPVGGPSANNTTTTTTVSGSSVYTHDYLSQDGTGSPGTAQLTITSAGSDSVQMEYINDFTSGTPITIILSGTMAGLAVNALGTVDGSSETDTCTVIITFTDDNLDNYTGFIICNDTNNTFSNIFSSSTIASGDLSVTVESTQTSSDLPFDNSTATTIGGGDVITEGATIAEDAVTHTGTTTGDGTTTNGGTTSSNVCSSTASDSAGNAKCIEIIGAPIESCSDLNQSTESVGVFLPQSCETANLVGKCIIDDGSGFTQTIYYYDPLTGLTSDGLANTCRDDMPGTWELN